MWASVGVIIAALLSSVTAVVVTLLNKEIRKHMRDEGDAALQSCMKIVNEVAIVGAKVDELAIAVQDLAEFNAREHALLWAAADKIAL